jgi:Ca-activated chloride channel family protein
VKQRTSPGAVQRGVKFTNGKTFMRLLTFGAIALGSLAWGSGKPGRQGPPTVRVKVQMVQLNVAVTNKKGRYVTGLRPDDFVVTEDGIRQKIAMFAEGDDSPRTVSEIEEEGTKQTEAGPKAVADSKPSSHTANTSTLASVSAGDAQSNRPLSAANIFVLFDTSNYMYRGFVYAQDAIADFVQSLQRPDRVALYSYSRDLYRASPLTPNRIRVLRGLRSTVAGADAALYDAMLLTLRDAARASGRRVIVVFSNGPDNASVTAPEDVEALAQSEGVSIYMISTRQAEQDSLSTKIFERVSSDTGGKAYFARNWTEERSAFKAVRDDLAHLYSLYYYPQPNPNRGWRAISVKLASPAMRKYRIRARRGYWPLSIPTGAGDPLR